MSKTTNTIRFDLGEMPDLRSDILLPELNCDKLPELNFQIDLSSLPELEVELPGAEKEVALVQSSKVSDDDDEKESVEVSEKLSQKKNSISAEEEEKVSGEMQPSISSEREESEREKEFFTVTWTFQKYNFSKKGQFSLSTSITSIETMFAQWKHITEDPQKHFYITNKEGTVFTTMEDDDVLPFLQSKFEENIFSFQWRLQVAQVDSNVQVRLAASANFFATHVIPKGSAQKVFSSPSISSVHPSLPDFSALDRKKCSKEKELRLVFERTKLHVLLKYEHPVTVIFPSHPDHPYGAFKCSLQGDHVTSCYRGELFGIRCCFDRNTRSFLHAENCECTTKTDPLEEKKRLLFFLQKINDMVVPQISFDDFLTNKSCFLKYEAMLQTEAFPNDHVFTEILKKGAHDSFKSILSYNNKERKIPENLKNFVNILRLRFGSHSVEVLQGDEFHDAPEEIKKLCPAKRAFPEEHFKTHNVPIPRTSVVKKDMRWPVYSDVRLQNICDFQKICFENKVPSILHLPNDVSLLVCVITADGMCLKPGFEICQKSWRVKGRIYHTED